MVTAQTELTSAKLLTLKLYVHETCVNGEASLGPLLVGVDVAGSDGAGDAFAGHTNEHGYFEITGTPGEWIFTASKTGYGTTTWSQEINKTETKHACLVANILLGIDVSSATVDWEQVYEAGFKFAFVKSSMGTVANSTFAERVKQHELETAKGKGLLIGVYHVACPCQNTPENEAEYFVGHVKKYLSGGYLRCALDVEEYKISGKGYNPSECKCKGAKDLSDWVKKWMGYVYDNTDPHVIPILYTGSWLKTEKWFDSNVINKYDLWVSDYGRIKGVLWGGAYPTCPRIGNWDNWAFWQYAENRTDVPGVTGKADLDRFDGSITELQSFVIPSAETKSLDVILDIDCSGSMGYNYSGYIGAARNAASMFISFMGAGDMVGVIRFREYASIDYPLAEIDSTGEQIQQAQAAINQIEADGYTSIGAGIGLAQEQLTSRGRPDSKQVIILLSDGYENRAPWVADVMRVIPARTTIYTIALGPESDQGLLQDIANETGGQYFFAPSGLELQALYNQIAANVTGREMVMSSNKTISQGEEKEESVYISHLSAAVFSLFWGGSTADLTLKSPSGTIITPEMAASNAFITYRSGPTFRSYEISSPAFGNWTMQIKGTEVPPGGEEYIAQVVGTSDLTLDAYFGQEQYSSGEPMTLLAVLARNNQPISTAIVMAEVRKPWLGTSSAMQVNGDTIPTSSSVASEVNEETIKLYDDGNHGDGAANDGLFGATYTPTTSGTYIFTFKTVGVVDLINRFTRTAQRAIFIPGGITPPARSTAKQFLGLTIKEVLNTPNPALQSTTFIVKGTGIQSIRVQIFDLAGGRAFDSGFIAGKEFKWNLTDDRGELSANGLYFYVITVRDSDGKLVRSKVCKLIILR